MTSQNQPASTEARQSASSLGFSMPNSLKVLHQTVEEFETFKREQGERLKACKEMITRLHKRVETADLDNRRLKAQVASLESDNGRLLRENEVFLRTQQNMDAAIHLACGTFHETVQFVADATRMTMPTVPSALGMDEPVLRQPQPELSLVRKQPNTAYQAPETETATSASDIAPLEIVKPLQESVRSEHPVSGTDFSTLDSVEAMANEIDAMLALELRDFDIPGSEVVSSEVADAGDETKAA
ncbi:hypothetical protein GOB57_10150 [Sinorhizobium meliloti]|nr:hypothetical protein [Sinorhizobium meliloti]